MYPILPKGSLTFLKRESFPFPIIKSPSGISDLPLSARVWPAGIYCGINFTALSPWIPLLFQAFS